MKKSLLVLTAALSFGFAAAQTTTATTATQAPALTDVPAGHWAKDAIDRLVSRGIILGYPDGTFRGTQNLTRYEAAVIIARLLDQMAKGSVSVDTETLTALQNAVQELAADLAALGVRVSDLEENAVTQDDFARLEDRINGLGVATGDTEAVAAITTQIDDLSTRVSDLEANYETLRADVDDNASSIAALNDLTVLLNQDILNLQDRVSALESGTGDLVGRGDFDALGSRVSVVETRVTDLGNRVATLEKYAFSIKPTLSATYYVARANRDFDIDRLFTGTLLSTGTNDESADSDTALDYADFTGSDVAVLPGAAGLYGFAAGAGPVRREGSTDISFGINLTNPTNAFNTSTSAQSGAYVTSAGGLNVNKVDVTFGVRSGLPDDGTVSDDDLALYPDVTGSDGTTYRPLFFSFKNATANFTVGNTPITVDFGKQQKFKFGDYIFDNDSKGRGDGYIVTVDGSNLPGFGAFKPMIKAVYGSNVGRRDVVVVRDVNGVNVYRYITRGGVYTLGTGETIVRGTPVVVNGVPSTTVFTGLPDNTYYRGVRAQITPVGGLTFGAHVAQEGEDAFSNYALYPYRDVTAYGADLHGSISGFTVDSEFARSNLTAQDGTVTNAQAFYAKTTGKVGPVTINDLNYRAISSNYDLFAGINEAAPRDTANGSTAPYGRNQVGFGVNVSTTLGPVSVGGYYDRQTKWATNFTTSTEPTLKVDRGVAAKVNLFSIASIRGGYYEFMANENAALSYGTGANAATRATARADITPGLGITIGAYYRQLNLNGVLSEDDNEYFRNSKYNSYFDSANAFKKQDGCGDQHPGFDGTDTDGVGSALTFSTADSTDATCYTEYGAEIAHNGTDAAALVKNLDLRFGYANRYSNATTSYSNTFTYGNALYNAKLGLANVQLKGVFARSTFDLTREAATVNNNTVTAAGIRVTTDPLTSLPFNPSFEGAFGYYSNSHDFAAATSDYTSTAMKYVAGVKLNQFLLPNTKLAVYYAGLNSTNREYVPFVYAAARTTGAYSRYQTPFTAGGTNDAGYFQDANNGARISQNGLYVEGNYYDLAFGYGMYNLSVLDPAGNQIGSGLGDGKAATGQSFKISYKVNF
ncbi:S-layer homology domain-containing protein [Deinococcus maricopensis]|uniref:S-layer domain-containing protein n=1 Tax=Deinococcus maricopensis (strain DSM 21211 / LMG 22137 / NRRL B-23946 / LB-34) TaxID=709986 RepID=E8U575_DEIML|nr:S-layer homology domain-containing protein [Deinococcus maricopensis]ADV66214.1 S-layer domain-containing protein [Deinococcus maricopensis DSM 21211]